MAGTDVSMQSGLYMTHLPGLIAAGEVPKSRLDDAVRRVLRVKAKLGLFDQPFRGLDKQDGQWVAEILGIDPAVFERAHAASATDQRVARAMHVALWPATL